MMGTDKVLIGYNMAVESLQANLKNAVNNSGLPIAVSYLAVKDLLAEMEKVRNEVVKKEIAEYERGLEDGQSIQPRSVAEQAVSGDAAGENAPKPTE